MFLNLQAFRYSSYFTSKNRLSSPPPVRTFPAYPRPKSKDLFFTNCEIHSEFPAFDCLLCSLLSKNYVCLAFYGA